MELIFTIFFRMDYGQIEVIIMLSQLLDAAGAGAELGKNSIYEH